MSAILALNLGSSSLKFAVFDLAAGAPRALRRGTRRWPAGARPDLAALFEAVLAEAEAAAPDGLAAAGHRVVHGGGLFSGPVAIDEANLAALRGLTPLAPLHQPLNLAGVDALTAARPDLAQFAAFDTAFHAAMPPEAVRFGLPRRFEAEGVRRYGFHGLSYRYMAARMAVLAPGARRVLGAHLGAGASLCAMRDGRSLDTSMGFSTLDGLLMATRCGALDPGAVLHLMRACGLSLEAVSELLHDRSGLLGVSGISGDMQVLLDHGSPQAREATDLYVYRIVREAGALVSVMGGLDALVFSGGVGENAAEIRRRVVEGLAWLGLQADPGLNAAPPGERRLDAGPGPQVWIVPADEELAVAQDVATLLNRA